MDNFEKVFFLVSLLAISFMYGIGVGKWGWFPHSFLDQAVEQARFVKSNLSDSLPNEFSSTKKFDRKGVRILQPKKTQPGLTLISSMWEGSSGWNPEVRLINSKGQVLHKWRVERTEVFQNSTHRRRPTDTSIHGVHLSPNGDIVLNLDYVGTIRMNSCGQIKWSLSEGNHHSVERDDGGAFWTPGVSSEPRSKNRLFPNGFPGLHGKKFWVDKIIKISEKGDKLREIDILSILLNSNLKRYIPKVLGVVGDTETDITHINDVEPLSKDVARQYRKFSAGDLLVSVRNLSLVFVFDPETLEVKWHSSDPYIRQHDPDFIGMGWVGVFDNNVDYSGGRLLGGSRIIAVDPSTDSTKVLFRAEHFDRFYTPVQGKWQMLRNGNILLSEPTAGRIVEVDSHGRLVWEWIHEPINNSRVPNVMQAIRLDVSRQEVASWPCSLVDMRNTSVQK